MQVHLAIIKDTEHVLTYHIALYASLHIIPFYKQYNYINCKIDW